MIRALLSMDPRYRNANMPDTDFESMNDQEIYDYFTNLDLELNKKPLDKQTVDSLPDVKFHKKNTGDLDLNSHENKCMICQCEYEEGESLKTLTCFHKFHSECIKEWFKNQNFCPICRTVIKF